MNRALLLFLSLIIYFSSFSQAEEGKKIKYRKLDYNDFGKLSINDTSAVIIDVFFDKKDNAALGQMSFLPVTAAIFIISPPISVGLTMISFPLFLHGNYLLVKYRKKKLYAILINYKETKQLPKWVRKKADKQLEAYELMKADY